MPVTRHPSHRSRRAALPHRAPASGQTCRHPKVPAVCGRARVTGMTRPCVRSLVCAATFPLASSLPSTSSAGSLRHPLFEGFLGTLKRSDSLHPCITVVPPGFTVRTWHRCTRPDTGPPGFRTPCVRACQRSPTPPGPSPPRHNEGRQYCLPRYRCFSGCAATHMGGTGPAPGALCYAPQEPRGVVTVRSLVLRARM